MFPPVDKQKSFPQREEEVLDFWQQHHIYEQTLAAREGAEPFVFYEGPPTANGMPHPGHCLTRAIKDLYPRYKTMRGYRCERKAGWDTHGLPVEVEVCKELGIHSKEEIENYGIEPFIQLCQKSVWRYMQEWERLTQRLGFWVNLEEAYVTYHQSYVESVWWSLKQLFDRGQLYQGHKIVWWWAQGGTALSAGEVGQGYREVADPSVFVKFPLLEDGQVSKTSLLVWTTTPWTLPSNQFAAVHPGIEYATVEDSETGEVLVLASDLVETLSKRIKRELNVLATCQGTELVGRRYVPPFDTYYTLAGAQYRQSLIDGEVAFKLGGAQRGKLGSGTDEYLAWRVVSADFVTTDSGSGIVHQAPAFGEVDYDVLVAEQDRFASGDGPTLINCVGPDGKFTDEAPEFLRGRWVKECDKDINRHLKEQGLLFHVEQYLHDYPFCWRAEEDPLIQYPRESWFIKTTAFKDKMLANNAEINWLPDHIQGGRFGKFLESNVDWALSRERFWGTPLPVWECQSCHRQEAVGGYEQLTEKPGVTGFEVWEAAKQKNPELPDDLRVHKPYIDAIEFQCECGETMRRVTEVIDCWYDSGAMPFAQWGYRGQESGPERERFESQFPADFISEAIDQTRGWFYSQLAISTMLFSKGEAGGGKTDKGASQALPHPFKNCIVLGLMLGEDGQKMSKSKRNYRDPSEIFDLYGADALRWYFFANQPPWTSIRYSEQAIKDSVPEFLLRLWNVYSFFTIYANIDGFEPTASKGEAATFAEKFASNSAYRPPQERGELDRWILSELNRTLEIVVQRMDEYDNYNACQAIIAYVDALSNWYVRRSRDRFWAKDKQDQSKLDAYWTLYECLLTTTKIIAPFTPFLAENLWQQLAALPLSGNVLPSVHLCDYPTAEAAAIDTQLSDRMDLVRLIASLGRNARTSAELKVRQPLSKVEVILADASHQAWLAEHAGVIAEELNVKSVEFSDQPEQYVDYQVLPNFKLLGKKLGKLMPKVKQALGSADGATLLSELKAEGKITIEVDQQIVELTDEEIEVRLSAKEGWAAANDRGVVVVLSTELTEELMAEGLARDIVRVVQDRRKERGCEFTDRIEVGLASESAEVKRAVEQFGDYIAQETLGDSVSSQPIENCDPIEVSLGDFQATLWVSVSGSGD